MSQEFLDRTFLGNPVELYLWVIGILIAGLLIKRYCSKLFSRIVFQFIKRYSGSVTMQEFHDLLKKPFSFFFLLIIGYIAFNHLTFP